MSALVSTVMMATLVVGPFYLSRALGLATALVGLVLSVGPLVAALTGVPAGRIADRFGAQRLIAQCLELRFQRVDVLGNDAELLDGLFVGVSPKYFYEVFQHFLPYRRKIIIMSLD